MLSEIVHTVKTSRMIRRVYWIKLCNCCHFIYTGLLRFSCKAGICSGQM